MTWWGDCQETLWMGQFALPSPLFHVFLFLLAGGGQGSVYLIWDPGNDGMRITGLCFSDECLDWPHGYLSEHFRKRGSNVGEPLWDMGTPSERGKEAQPPQFCVKHMTVSGHWGFWGNSIIFFLKVFPAALPSTGFSIFPQTSTSSWWASPALNSVKCPRVIFPAADTSERGWIPLGKREDCSWTLKRHTSGTPGNFQLRCDILCGQCEPIVSAIGVISFSLATPIHDEAWPNCLLLQRLWLYSTFKELL